VLSSRITGQILAVHFREGDRVQTGQLLLEIDNREAAAQLRKVQAGLREAQEMLEEVERNIQAAESAKEAAEANKTLAISTFKRYQTLLERRSVSPQEFEEVQARQSGHHRGGETGPGKCTGRFWPRRNRCWPKWSSANAEVNQSQLSVGYAQIASAIDGL